MSHLVRVYGKRLSANLGYLFHVCARCSSVVMQRVSTSMHSSYHRDIPGMQDKQAIASLTAMASPQFSKQPGKGDILSRPVYIYPCHACRHRRGVPGRHEPGWHSHRLQRRYRTDPVQVRFLEQGRHVDKIIRAIHSRPVTKQACIAVGCV